MHIGCVLTDMGLSLFLADQAFESWRTWTLFAISFLAMLGARTANVFPNCHLVNNLLAHIS